MTHGKYGYLPRDFSKPAPEFESYILSAGTDPLPELPLVRGPRLEGHLLADV